MRMETIQTKQGREGNLGSETPYPIQQRCLKSAERLERNESTTAKKISVIFLKKNLVKVGRGNEKEDKIIWQMPDMIRIYF